MSVPVVARTVLQNFRYMYVTSYRVLSDAEQSRKIVELGPTTSVAVTDVDCALVVVSISLVLEDRLPLVDTTPSEVGVVLEEVSDADELSAD